MPKGGKVKNQTTPAKSKASGTRMLLIAWGAAPGICINRVKYLTVVTLSNDSKFMSERQGLGLRGYVLGWLTWGSGHYGTHG